MEFLEIAKSRYSVRDYKSRKVELVLHPVSFYSLLFFQILLYFMKKGIWRK